MIVIGNNIIRGIELKTKAEILELPQKNKHLIEILSQQVHSNEKPHRYKQNVFFLYIYKHDADPTKSTEYCNNFNFNFLPYLY